MASRKDSRKDRKDALKNAMFGGWFNAPLMADQPEANLLAAPNAPAVGGKHRKNTRRNLLASRRNAVARRNAMAGGKSRKNAVSRRNAMAGGKSRKNAVSRRNAMAGGKSRKARKSRATRH